MIKVKAGVFSAAQSIDGALYVWGEGEFGKFHSPHQLKSQIDVLDFHVSRQGLALILSR